MGVMMTAFFGIDHPNERAGGAWRDPSRITMGVFHVTVNAPSTDSANKVADWQSKQKGYVGGVAVYSGYHSLFDSNEHLRYFPDDRIAHGVRRFNSVSFHLSYACHIDSWEKYPAWALKAMGNAAPEIRRLHDTYGLPYRIITLEEALRGIKGFSFHSILDPDRRGDPGRGFDVDLQFELASGLVLPASHEDVHMTLKHGDGKVNGRELEVQQFQHLVNRVIVITGGWPGEDGPDTPYDQRDTIPADGDFGNVTAERAQHAIWRAEQWVFGHPLYAHEDRGSRITDQTQTWLVAAVERVKEGRAVHPSLQKFKETLPK